MYRLHFVSVFHTEARIKFKMNTKHIREEGFMKIKSYSIRIEQDLLHKLHYMAAYDGRSANSQVLYYIKQAVVAFEKKNGPIEIEANK